MLNQQILVEKYRPKSFEEFIGINQFKGIIEICRKEPFKLPNFLFVGKAGCGKTTLARLIIKELNADSMVLNASDESGIDVIRGKVKEYAKSLAFNPDSPKIIFMDEADFIGGGSSKTAMASLRMIIEQYSRHVRFILSCNYEDKIIPELHSRLTKIYFGNYNKDEILIHLKNICNKEGITYEEKALQKLININFPDIRSMVKFLQSNKNITLNILSSIKYSEQIFLLIQQRKLLQARQLWVENNLDCKQILLEIFYKIIDNEIYNIQQKKDIIDVIAETDYRLAISATPDIQLFNFAVKVKL